MKLVDTQFLAQKSVDQTSLMIFIWDFCHNRQICLIFNGGRGVLHLLCPYQPFKSFSSCYMLNWTCVLTYVIECRGPQRGPLSGRILYPTTELVSFCSSDLIQDLSVTGQELRQLFDELLDALQSSLLHNGACLLCDRLWDRVSGQILQCCRQVQ